MRVPFVDLKRQYATIAPLIEVAIRAVIEETAFVGGPHVRGFEQAFAQRLGALHCIGCGNGTDAIYIVLKMLGVGPGDEVITTATSWISTSETISQTGAKPVFVDIDPDYYTLNIEQVAQSLSDRTRAVIPVHLYGQLADIARLMPLCDGHGVAVVEDSAQAHLTAGGGRFAGRFGKAGAFSFYPGKNLGAYGDAGCIVTDDDALSEKCRMYANHGALRKHQHEFEGINSRLDGFQAAILAVKLPLLDGWTTARRRVARWYDELLADTPEVRPPAVRPESEHSFHLYVIRCERRDDLRAYLGERGVSTGIHYPTALPFLAAYRHLEHIPQEFPEAVSHQAQVLSLPMFAELEQREAEYAAGCISDFYRGVTA